MPPKKGNGATARAAKVAKAAPTKSTKAAPNKVIKRAAPSKAIKNGTAAKRSADEDEPAKKTAATKAEKDAPAKIAKAVPKSATKVVAETGTKKAQTKTTAKPTEEMIKPATGAKAAKIAKVAAVHSVSEESDKENKVAPPATETKANSKRKRAPSVADEPEGDESSQPAKKAKKEAATNAAPKPKPAKKAVAPKVRVGKKINEAPTETLNVFVFGEGTSGELGLGSVRIDGKKPIDVKRPRLNVGLKGIVQIACGGMHVVALTKDNKILTWGVNDQGALGRDTTWSGGLRDMDKEDSGDEDEDDDDTGLNPNESNPGEIDMTDVASGTKFTQVVASDSASFALTEDGHVYGWGTFRNNEGVLGFIKGSAVTQKTPVLLPALSGITQLAAGSNHILALDSKKKVLAWGSGQQCQLARKLVERDHEASLVPAGIGSLPRQAKPAKLACGSYHSFVIDEQGRVFAWGLNNYAELGLEMDAGEDGGTVLRPTLIESLVNYRIAAIAGGEHHSLACTDDGKLLTWGRIDGFQVGQPASVFTHDNAIWDEHDKPRILATPTVVEGVPPVVHVAAGTDHSIVITRDGQAFSWGFSANYQTGQGTTNDIEIPTLIDNTAVRGKKLTFAGAGGQFSILASSIGETRE